MADQRRLALNGFQVEVNPSAFSAYQRDLADPSEVAPARLAAGEAWSLWPAGGVLYGVPRVQGAVVPDGMVESKLAVSENLGLVAYVVNQALPGAVPGYRAFRRRPFQFLGRRREFVAEIMRRLGHAPEVMSGFLIRPRYSLEARVVMPVEEAFIGLFVTLSTRYDITAKLAELAAAGVSLTGLDVVRRAPAPGQRRLVGRIDRLVGGEVVLSESFDQISRISAAEVAVEGSKEAFASCLRQLLGDRYSAFESHRAALDGQLLGGPGVAAMLTDMGRFLGGLPPIALGVDLRGRVREQLTVGNSGTHRSVYRAPGVSYCFDPARTKQNTIAWRGLTTYGPFSRDSFATHSPRIVVVAPHTAQGVTEAFVRALRDGVPSTAYQSGFAATFRLSNPAFTLQKVQISGQPHDAYRRAIETALSGDQQPDAAIVVILDEHADLPAPVNPYLHAKALLLMAGIPSQEMKLSTMRQRPAALAFALQNASVALYAKLNGVPWTVNHHLPIADEIVVGLGIAELVPSRYQDRKRCMGITTVFRGDGNYLLANLSRECTPQEYPLLLRTSVQDVLADIKARNGWRPGDTVRIVCHTSLPMRDHHLDRLIGDCVATVGSEQNVEFAFLTVGDRQPFTMLDPHQPGRNDYRGRIKGALAPERGTIMQISDTQRLLAITGPSLIKLAGAPLPRQLHLRLHRASTFRDLDYLAEQALKFTSLSWRSTMPTSRPVTIHYSELMADLLARLRAVPYWSPALLNTRLRHSRWFL
ncbi:hypothetical protein ACFP2T_47350 [Plantactinospora solaniradicis]|uniref:Protein argonaute n=1 Tax=Plantactinospora solaniradicis TaxID=1723736 RepID=A0ABW1KT36_9ACTN